MTIVYTENSASSAQISDHFAACENDFYQDLSSRVDLGAYAQKIHDKAWRFEAWAGDQLIALLAIYYNGESFDFITNLSVVEAFQKKGIARELLLHAIEKSRASMHAEIRLEMSSQTVKARDFYQKCGFVLYDQKDATYYMKLNLEN